MILLEREHALDRLRQGPPGCLVLVSGEAGVGKSSLVRAYCDGVKRPVLVGMCDALRSPRPLGPLRDIARIAGGRLARIMAADSSRYEIFEAFLDHLDSNESIAVIEDAHWADEATIDLQLFLARRIASTRSTLIVTYRDDETGDPHHPMHAFLGALANDRSVLRLSLMPLSIDAVAVLAEPCGVNAAELHARTGGNPFFVTEALADPGRAVPTTVQDAVLARAAVLRGAERDVLDSVAIFPGQAILSLLHAATQDIDASLRTGMLVRDGLRVRFRHELARLAIENSIPPARRADLHARALADLAARGEQPAQLAFHAEEAGDEAAVSKYAPLAAARAVAVGAHRQAADHYAQALRYARQVSVGRRAELLEAYAEECTNAGRDEEALTASAEAVEAWRSAHEPEREAASLADRAQLLWRVGESALAQSTADSALTLAASLPSGRGLVAAYTTSAVFLMLASDERAIEIGTQAISLAERFGDHASLALALNAVGTSQWSHHPDQAAANLARSIEVAQAINDDRTRASCLVNFGAGAAAVRRYPEARERLRAAISWCGSRDLDNERAYALAWWARCLFEQGEWEEAANLLTSPELFAGRSFIRIVALTVLGRLKSRRGEPGARQALDQAWGLAERTGELQRIWPVAAGLAEDSWLSGEPIDDRVGHAYALAVRLRHPWAVGELEQWIDEKDPQAHLAAAPPYQLAGKDKARAWSEIGCPYESALALAEDETCLQEAFAILYRLGARPAADRVAKMMRDLGMRTPRRSTLSHPAGLTAREADVLNLLREGLRNVEIATRLQIASKTVDHHVSAILAKLNVRTRQEAAGLVEHLGQLDP